jgi:protein TonB
MSAPILRVLEPVPTARNAAEPRPPSFEPLDAGRPGVLASFWVSLAAHLVIVAAAVLGPLLLGPELPDAGPGGMAVFFYDPPPPPPLPLPRGNPLVPERPGRQRPRPERAAEPRETSAPSDSARPRFELPPDFAPEDLGEQEWGSETGSPLGVPEGMEGGVPEGEIGGVLGGVVGGVVGGRLGGTLVVRDYDRPPRVLRKTKPRYPERAFIDKIEGTVLLEILIDVDGRVTHARVVESVPALDEAALATVREWLFEPALKGGRPVPTLARAPIRFVIY